MGLDWVDAIEEEPKETLEEIQQTALIKKKANGRIADCQLAEGLRVKRKLTGGGGGGGGGGEVKSEQM